MGSDVVEISLFCHRRLSYLNWFILVWFSFGEGKFYSELYHNIYAAMNAHFVSPSRRGQTRGVSKNEQQPLFQRFEIRQMQPAW